jgi:thioester reductase-like protein
MKILITGATGFIGKRLTDELISEGHDIYVLVRRASLEKARALFSHSDKVQFVIGDLTNNDVVDHVTGTEILKDEIESVIHLAAYYDLRATMSDAYTHNVIGTQNLLFLLQKMKSLRTFHYVSTYAVSGIHEGDFNEEDLNASSEFPDFYSKTKMQAEFLVRNVQIPGIKIRIYRPGIIIGDSRTGEMEKIDGPYYFFRFFQDLSKWTKKLPLKILPVSYHSESLLPLLPVDTLVTWMKEMVKNPTDHVLRTYHLLPSEKIFVSQFIESSLREFDINMRVQWIPFPELYAKVLPYLKVPKETALYMHSKTRYSTRNLKADFPALKGPKMKSYLPVLIKKFNEKTI